jgi:hypothetical protein
MNLEIYPVCTDVRYMNDRNEWQESFVVGRVTKRNELYYLVAGYGPPVHYRMVMPVLDKKEVLK